MQKGSILIVDDEKLVRLTLGESLRDAGYDVTLAEDGRSALRIVEESQLDVVLLDYVLPDLNGLEMLSRIHRSQPDAAVIMITSHSTVENAVESLKAGASDYVAKPFSPGDILLRLDKVLEARRLRSELGLLRDEQLRRFGMAKMVGRSQAVGKVFQLVERIVDNPDATILIQGESGTGKDLLAKVIHYGGPRANGPYMNITCTALPEALLESELFGHEKGAFTDAKALKKGLVEVADGGTCFLDEIGDMSLTLQARLLRFLEEKAFRRVGGQKDLHVKVRIIAATNRTLEDMIRKGEFREDLYFRLNVIPIVMPPLRERKGDIPLLVHHFIGEYNREFKKKVDGVEPDVMARLEAYRWPGNVRELKNTIERAMILASGNTLRGEDFLDNIQKPAGIGPSKFKLPAGGVDIELLEKDLLWQALESTGGRQAEAGQLLGLNRDQVRYRILKYGFQAPAASG